MRKSRLVKILKGRIFLICALAVILLIITYIVAPKSYTVANLKQILHNLSYLSVMTVGVALLLMCGGIDLATSAHATISMIIFAMLLKTWPGVPWIIPAIIAILFGILAGSINAILAEGLKMMAFICTIGMMSVWGGIANWSTRGVIIAISRKSFVNLATLYVFDVIPVLFLFAVFVIAVYSLIMKRTRFGRSIPMVGGNPAAARLAGLNPTKIRAVMFINNGVLAALAALIWAAQQKQGSATGMTASTPEMTALTAAILGGVAFGGGAGTLGGAFFGVMLMNILSYALQAMNTQIWLNTLINGSLLVIALTIDRFTNRRVGGGMAGMPGMSR